MTPSERLEIERQRQSPLDADRLRYAMFTLYRDLFDWFFPAMRAARFDGLDHSAVDGPAVDEAWRRAHVEWYAMTGLSPLLAAEDWQHAADVAGWPNLKDLYKAKEAILAWAKEKHRKLQIENA